MKRKKGRKRGSHLFYLISAFLCSATSTLSQEVVSSQEVISSKDTSSTVETEGFLERLYKNKPIEFGIEYQYWFPEDMKKATLENTGLFVLKLKVFDILTLKTTLNSLTENPASRGEVIKQDSSSKESYASIMGALPIVPTSKLFGWSFDIEAYGQAEKFTSTLKPKETLYYHDFKGNTYTLQPGEKRTFETNFIEFGIGLSSKERKNSMINKLFIGIYYQEYQKPYTPQVRDYEAFPNHIFFTKFKSYGLRFAAEFSNEPDKEGFFGKMEAKLGKGKMKLTSNLSMTQLLGNDEDIWFLGGELIGGYKKFISSNFFIRAFAGADLRIFIVGYKDASGTTHVNSDNAANQDFILKGGISLGYLF